MSANPNKYLKFLGSGVEKTAILNDSLVIYYYKNDDSGMISVFTGKEEMLTIEPSFQDAVIDSFSFIEKTGELLCFLEDYDESKCYFWKVSPQRNKEDQKITIDENTFTTFTYPYYFQVKGGHELIWYDIPGDKFTYASVPSPIIHFGKDPVGYGQNYYSAVVDLGNHFTTLSLSLANNFYDSTHTLSLTYNKVYMKKLMLPKDFFIKYLKTVEVMGGKNTNKYNAFALQFNNYLVTYSNDWKDEIIIKSRSYKDGELIPMNFDYNKKGLLMFHKGEKKILFHPEPYDFNDKARTVVMYASKDPLKEFSVLYQQYGTPSCFVVDEPKNVKRCSINTEGDKPTYSNLVNYL